MKYFAIVGIFLLVSAQVAFAGWFGPETYEECIQEYVPRAKCNYAVVKIRRTCESEFIDKKIDGPHLEYYECIRDKLTGIELGRAAIALERTCVNEPLREIWRKEAKAREEAKRAEKFQQDERERLLREWWKEDQQK